MSKDRRKCKHFLEDSKASRHKRARFRQEHPDEENDDKFDWRKAIEKEKDESNLQLND